MPPRTLSADQASLAAGESSVGLTKQYLAQIAERDGAINAFLFRADQSALAAAAASDMRRSAGESFGALDGIAIAIKDNIAVADMPLSAGMATRRGHIATADAEVVARLRAAGAVILGKLNLHEGALGADNDNPHFGACHNPRKLGYTPGGSSGGSAAAVAAGFCPVSLGTDTMGSVRIPAAYCGVVGFKPSYGLLSQRGLIPACYALDHVGILAHAVTDIAPVLRVLAGPDALDPYSRVYAPMNPYSRPRFATLSGLGVDAPVAAVFARALAQLQPLIRPSVAPSQVNAARHFDDYDFARMRRAGLLATEADMAAFHRLDLRDRPALFSDTLRTMLAFAQSKSAVDLAAAQAQIATAKVKAAQVFADCDILICPSTPQVAFAFGEKAPANQADLTSFANLSGCPAISIPCGFVADLPVGLQLIAAPGADFALLGVAERCAALLQAVGLM
jgi:Asp-tRNA(Asn)/Glu-tRNA(Gln) amidotransferase A subunit family amidase